MDNDSVKHVIGRDYIQFLSFTSHCDCGTILGSIPTESEITENEVRQEEADEKERKSLKRKKWSDSKIDRYFKDKTNAASNKPAETYIDSFENWALKVSKALKFATSRIGLFFHDYSGSLQYENVNLAEKAVYTQKYILTGLRQLKQDELIWFE